MNPVPPADVLDALYNSDFYTNYRRFEAARIARERYFSISMYRDLRQLASWIRRDPSLAILDFGCGPGAFLALLRDEFGFADVEGLELSCSSVAFARRHYQLPVVSSPAELRRGAYDYVVLLEVIEHLPNPAAVLAQVVTLVKPGGHLLITTPAVDNLMARFFPALCKHYTALSHVSLFTERSLRQLLARFGFTIQRLETDRAFVALQSIATSVTHNLDFVSPQGDDDQTDAMYIPNALGRALGCKWERMPAHGFVGRAARKIDRFLMRHVWWRLPLPATDHLYVLAYKEP